MNDNNGNGKLDPGENAGIGTWVQNAGNQPATNVRGTLRTTCPYLTITDSLYSYGNIAAGDSANNTADPYDVTVQSTCPAGTIANFTLRLVSAESTWNYSFSQTVGLAPGTIIWGPKPLPGFPSTGFIYGLAYYRTADRLHVLDAYGRTAYVCSSDSFATFIGTVAAPDTNCDDASFSRYDGRLWVTSFYLKQIWKIDPSTGVVLRQFANPANDYPVGLAWNGQRLWLADRRTTLGGVQLLYYSDTMGVAAQYNSPVQGYYNSRCLAYDSLGNTIVQAQTWFNSGGTAVDSCGATEYTNTPPPALTGQKFLRNTGWNIRGIEFDPRDGNFWITIPQGGAYLNQIVKVKGFHSPAIGVAEQKSAGRTPLTLTAYPNPASGKVVFSMGQSAKGKELSIYDITGRLVRSFTLSSMPSALCWNGTDRAGNRLPAGVYFAKLASDQGEAIQKVVLTR